MKKLFTLLVLCTLAALFYGCSSQTTTQAPAFVSTLPTEWVQTTESGFTPLATNSSDWQSVSRMSAGENLFISYGMLKDASMSLRDFSKKTFESYLPQVAATDDIGWEEDLSGGRSYFVFFVQNVINDGYYMEVFTLPTPESTTFVSVSSTGATKAEAMKNAFQVYQTIYPTDDLDVFVQ